MSNGESLNGFIKKLYAMLRKRMRPLKKRISRMVKTKRIHDKGHELIYGLEALLNTKGYKHFFDMGTLLGIIREGDFISYDFDIDIAIYLQKEQTPITLRHDLQEIGAKIMYSYSTEEIGVFEESFLIQGVKVDMNYYTTQDSNDICYLAYRLPDDGATETMRLLELRCKRIKAIKKIGFVDCMISVPSEPEAYLEERYGENWKKPDKKWIYYNGPSATKIEGKVIVNNQLQK